MTNNLPNWRVLHYLSQTSKRHFLAKQWKKYTLHDFAQVLELEYFIRMDMGPTDESTSYELQQILY